MDWLDKNGIYTDEKIAILPVLPERNPHIRAERARVFVRDGVASLQVLLEEDYGDGEPDYVWHTTRYTFTEEEMNGIFREVRP